MAKSLDTLEQEYQEAKEEFRANRDDEAAEARFEKAKKAFADARVAQRQAEEADPDNPRGQTMVTVADDDAEDGEQ